MSHEKQNLSEFNILIFPKNGKVRAIWKEIHGKSLTWFNDKVTLFPTYNACIFAFLFCFIIRMFSCSFIRAWRGLLAELSRV